MSRHPARPGIAAALALLTAIASVCGFAYAAGDRQGASVARGREIAMAVCSACHVVAGRQDIAPILQEPTPSFQDVADNPKTSTGSLRQFLRTTHWDWKTLPMKMPRRDLTSGQTEEVISYILSLRRRG